MFRTSNYANYSRRKPKRSAKHAYTGVQASSIAHAGSFLKETVANRGFIKIYDGPSFNSRVRHQGRKTSRPQIWENSQEAENIIWPIPLKKRCKKRDYEGIHDRFLRDHVFRGRMIENNRDEEVCRVWDVLADEDHTYHMSQEEYFYYRNKWWLSLNKSGNDTQPLRKRSDFKQALSTLQRLHREAGGQQLRPIP